MKAHRRNLLGVALISLFSTPTFAQFGGLGGLIGGGKSSGGSDPAKLKADLISYTETSSLVIARVSDALGLKEQAAKANQLALDIKAGKTGLKDGVSQVQELSNALQKDIKDRESQGQKLDAAQQGKVMEALLGFLIAWPMGKQIIDGVKSIDKTAILQYSDLIESVTLLPNLITGFIGMLNAGISLLSFSGADTTNLKAKAAEALQSAGGF